MNRRSFLKSAAAGLLCGPASKANSRPPNIVLILADDLGYGDIGCYGSRIRTPNIDRLASEGMRFTDFYSAASVCSPARAALLTGKYAVRVNVPGVLLPQDDRGLPAWETTMAGMLKEAGYRSACIGKWHIGSKTEYLPTNRGFDEFFGLPHSHDMWPRPLMRQTEVIEPVADIRTLTQRFTEQAASFIGRQKESPFFLYLPHTAPHIPLAPSAKFKGKSRLGPYGDTIQELDWSVGEVLRVIQENGLEENTLVLFTSDNGPWYQGSAGIMRGRKGETLDGGMREPLLARFPGNIPANTTCRGLANAMDILPTLARLTGALLPAGPLDGADIWPMLSAASEEVDREPFLYFDFWNLQCARMGRWKLHMSRYNTRAWEPPPQGGRMNLPLPQPELYDMTEDPEEGYDLSGDFPEIVTEIRARVDRMLPTFPDPVRIAWRDTMRLAVEDTPAGAPPTPKTP